MLRLRYLHIMIRFFGVSSVVTLINYFPDFLQADKLCDEATALPDGKSETKCKDLFIEIKSMKEVIMKKCVP